MFLMIINKSVPEISIPLLTGGAAALFASIGLALMLRSNQNWLCSESLAAPPYISG